MTTDGGIVLAHNTMARYVDAQWNVIRDIQPAKGHHILMQDGPGWIHRGTDFFTTDAGLVGAETTIGGFKGFDERGTAEFGRIRRATQKCLVHRRVGAPIIRRGNNGGYANAWLLGDIHTKEIARLELGLKYVGLEKKKDGYFVGSNVAEDRKILRLETSRDETDMGRRRMSSAAIGSEACTRPHLLMAAARRASAAVLHGLVLHGNEPERRTSAIRAGFSRTARLVKPFLPCFYCFNSGTSKPS